MESDLEIFDYFIDDLLSSNAYLLNYELDIILMQYLFNSIALEKLRGMDLKKNIIIASQILMMKYFYEKFWVPFFGGILSKFVFLIEGKQKNLDKNTKN